MSNKDSLESLLNQLHSKSNYKVCLDAGHYGRYNVSPCNKSYSEAEIVWCIAETISLHLSNFSNIEVIKTRTDQTKDLSLAKRGQASKDCDLFLSIHTNACGTQSVDYAASLVYSGDSKESLLSQYIGERLHQVCRNVLQLSSSKSIKKMASNGISEYYGVLRSAKGIGTPGIILECGFHTNPSTVTKLLDTNVRNELAIAIANELVYFLQGDTTPRIYNTNTNIVTQSPSLPTTTSTSIEERGRKVYKELKQYNIPLTSIAGILGNMQAESSILSNNLQNSFNKKLGMTDEEYTSNVNNNTYTNFIHDSAGYGLCQWTYWSRKKGLLEYITNKQLSIDSISGQVGYLVYELKNSYKSVYNSLINSNDVTYASNVFLLKYEKPADQSKSVQTKRANISSEWYVRILEWEKEDD
jgi:N-acetylmuramoyl-L-alanine amidase